MPTHRDVQAGLDGGARVVGVATGVESVAELESAGAHAAVADLTDLRVLFEAIEVARRLGPARRYTT